MRVCIFRMCFNTSLAVLVQGNTSLAWYLLSQTDHLEGTPAGMTYLSGRPTTFCCHSSRMRAKPRGMATSGRKK